MSETQNFDPFGAEAQTVLVAERAQRSTLRTKFAMGIGAVTLIGGAIAGVSYGGMAAVFGDRTPSHETYDGTTGMGQGRGPIQGMDEAPHATRPRAEAVQATPSASAALAREVSVKPSATALAPSAAPTHVRRTHKPARPAKTTTHAQPPVETPPGLTFDDRNGGWPDIFAHSVPNLDSSTRAGTYQEDGRTFLLYCYTDGDTVAPAAGEIPRDPSNIWYKFQPPGNTPPQYVSEIYSNKTPGANIGHC